MFVSRKKYNVVVDALAERNEEVLMLERERDDHKFRADRAREGNSKIIRVHDEMARERDAAHKALAEINEMATPNCAPIGKRMALRASAELAAAHQRRAGPSAQDRKAKVTPPWASIVETVRSSTRFAGNVRYPPPRGSIIVWHLKKSGEPSLRYDRFDLGWKLDEGTPS